MYGMAMQIKLNINVRSYMWFVEQSNKISALKLIVKNFVDYLRKW